MLFFILDDIKYVIKDVNAIIITINITKQLNYEQIAKEFLSMIMSYQTDEPMIQVCLVWMSLKSIESDYSFINTYSNSFIEDMKLNTIEKTLLDEYNKCLCGCYK